MLLDGGAYHGARILVAADRREDDDAGAAGADPNVRGLGWDIDSAYSSNRGELLPLGSFGHTGFTGTSLWIDPATRHVRRLPVEPRASRRQGRRHAAARARRDGRGVGDRPTAAGAVAHARWTGRDFGPSGAAAGAAPTRRRCMTGIDVLRAAGLRAARRASASASSPTTPAARATARPTIDLLHDAKDVKLVALFSPEHGIRGMLDANVPAETDEKTGLPIHSLYGDTRRPTAAMLDGLDTIVIDLQDIGARFYTYMTTMAYVMEEAAKRKLPVVVLDRPNPVNGCADRRAGARQGRSSSFIGYFPRCRSATA